MPQQNIVHIDQALTNLSLAIFNDNADYISEQMLPSVPVNKRSDLYFIYGKEHLRVRESRVRPGALADELEYTLSRGNFQCEMRGRRHLVLDEDRQAEDDPLSAEMDAAQILAEAMKLIREWDTSQYLTSSANLPNYTALGGTSQWSDYVNSTPLTDIKTARSSVRINVLKPANIMMLPYDVGLTLVEHPSIKDLVKYTDPNALTEAGLPPVIRGLRIIETAGAYDSSTEGRSFTAASLWGKNVIIAYVSPNPGRKTISLGYTFVAPDATTSARGLATRQYREEARRGDWIESNITFDLRVVASGAAYLYQTAIA